MKQSTRLLSILLAMVMLIGVLSVGVSAEKIGLTKSAVAYDSIDDAVLTPQQVSTIIMDLLDNELLPSAGLGTIDLSIAGSLRTDTVNHLIADLVSISGGAAWAIAKALLGDIGDLNFGALKTGSNPYQRSHGDLTLFYQLIQFLNDNRSILGKIAYGIGVTNGIGFGVAASAVGDVDLNITDMLRGLLFDELLLGSYAYPEESDVGYYTTPPSTVYTDWEDLSTKPFTSADAMVNKAIENLLKTPQDKVSTLVEGKVVRKYDPDSVILPTVTAAQVNLNTNSVFSLLDGIIQLAYNTLATEPLNHDLKRLLMKETDVEFNEIKNPSAGLLSAFAAVEATGIKNYFVNAATFKYNDNWYFSDYVTRGVDANSDGITDTDLEGTEITEKVRRFFKADLSDVDELFDIINWDYEFTETTYDFAAGKATYGSIVGQLNHLIYVILDTVLSAQAKSDIAAFLNDGNGFYIDGDNSNFPTNLIRIIKYALCTYTNKFFYKNPDYVDENGVALPAFVADVKACASIEELVAYIAIPLMKDILPEMILPVAFTDGLEIEQVAALALREAISDITPALNFDSRIFKADTLTSATGRELAVLDQAGWQDLILDMGLNLAVIYLDNVTNINLDTDAAAAIYAQAGWRSLLEEVVDWAVGYIGSGSTSVLVGLDPTTLGSVRGTYNGNAFTILTTALNKLLPLGFICGPAVNTTTGVLDVDTLFWQLYDAICDLDLASLLSLFGRSTAPNNFLAQTNIIKQVLDILNRILNVLFNDATILQNTASLDNAILNQANLKQTIIDLLLALNTRKAPILTNLFPVLAKFISDWGGEQVLANPIIGLENRVATTNGALTDATFTIANGAKGVWRSYMDGSTRVQDNQYKCQITSVTCTATAGTVSNIRLSTTAALDYGQSLTVTYNVASVPAAGGVALFNIKYKVFDEDGNAMSNGKVFEANRYTYLSQNPTDEGTMRIIAESSYVGNSAYCRLYSPRYVSIEGAVETLPNLRTYRFDHQFSTQASRSWARINSTTPATQNGITLGTVAKQEMKVDESFDYYSFTVNAATYDAAVTAGTITSGTTLTWAVNGTVKGKDFAKEKSGTQNLQVKFYNNADVDECKEITNRETGNVKIASDYKTGTVYADKVLKSTPGTEEDPQMTNFTATGVDPETEETVTVIDGAQAWATYVSALNNAIRHAYQAWNANSVYAHKAAYEALRIATNDVNYCKKTSYELAQEGGENNDTAVEALKTLYEGYEDNLDSYKDYMLYRFNRYEDNARSARNLINIYKRATAVIDTKVFPYINISVTELNQLLALDTTYAPYISALLEDRTPEEIEGSGKAKAEAFKTYVGGYTALDVNQISNLLQRTYARLLPREGGTKTEYLAAEIASALAIYGSAATSTTYSEKSWARYLDRLATAQAELAAPKNNQTVFDAKYHLQRAVNGLILIEDGADYSGLEDAIAAAQAVLANHTDFLKGQNKVIGLVIAALGRTLDDVNLFPGAALDVVDTPYALDDQDRIDDAELKLRMALSNVRYATTAIDPNAGATTENQTENDAYYAFVPANLAIANVYGYLNAITVPANVTDVLPVTITPNATNAGTGTVVTYYGKLGGVSIPVASYSVVVIGDVTGDSAIDSADAMLADLVVNTHKEVDGAFLKAALADPATAAGGIVTIEALGVILNIAVGAAA